MTRCPTALLLLGSLSGCATLGGTVKGDFACRAPTGTCAPMTEIDAKAVTALSGSEGGPSAVAPARQPAVSRGGGMGPRTGERLLAVLLPAHVDAAGVLHDAATVHVVVEAPGWRLEPSRPNSDTQSLPEFSRSSAPSSLREAVAGASAPAIEGLEMLPARAPHMIADGPPVPAAAGPAPTAAAIAAARSGHRIADRSTSPAAYREAQPGALPRGKTIVPTGDPAAALARVAGIAAASEPRSWAFDPTITVADDLRDARGRVIVARGTRVNPLDTVPLRQRLVFIDGDSEDQVAWAMARTTALNAKLILVSGSPFALMKAERRRFYFDQSGTLTTKLGIHVVPAVVEQRGRVLAIREMVIQGTKGDPK